MNRRRILINHDRSLSDSEVIDAIVKVIGMGKISCTRQVDHYCHHTILEDGTEISATITRSGSDVFHVYRGDRHE